MKELKRTTGSWNWPRNLTNEINPHLNWGFFVYLTIYNKINS
jgi:hypothetical protein